MAIEQGANAHRREAESYASMLYKPRLAYLSVGTYLSVGGPYTPRTLKELGMNRTCGSNPE